jgi:hypothetical protein
MPRRGTSINRVANLRWPRATLVVQGSDADSQEAIGSFTESLRV